MEAVRVILASDRKTFHLLLTWQDYDVLHSISDALKPLKQMTDALSGEKCVTVSAVKPLLNYNTTDILLEKEGDSELTKEMKEVMKVNLEIRYSNPELSQLLELAPFLDPHVKLGHVSDRESILKEVEEQMCGASNDVTDGEGGHSSVSDDDGSSASEPPRKKPKRLNKILAKSLGAT